MSGDLVLLPLASPLPVSVAEFKFEPSHQRTDIDRKKLPVVGWHGVVEDVARILRWVDGGLAAEGMAIFIDEGDFAHARRPPLYDSSWAHWGSFDTPTLDVWVHTYTRGPEPDDGADMTASRSRVLGSSAPGSRGLSPSITSGQRAARPSPRIQASTPSSGRQRRRLGFVSESPAGWSRARTPRSTRACCGHAGCSEVPVLYIGKATAGASGRRHLRKRVTELVEFGAGRPVGHRGGRCLWQVQGSSRFVVAWRVEAAPTRAENELLDQFLARHKPAAVRQPRWRPSRRLGRRERWHALERRLEHRGRLVVQTARPLGRRPPVDDDVVAHLVRQLGRAHVAAADAPRPFDGDPDVPAGRQERPLVRVACAPSIAFGPSHWSLNRTRPPAISQ